MTGRVIPFPSRAPEPPGEGEFEELTRVRDQAEALVVRGLLEAHGIEVLLRTHVAPSVHPFSVGDQGAVRVLVRRDALATCRRLLAASRPGPSPEEPRPAWGSTLAASLRRSSGVSIEGPVELVHGKLTLRIPLSVGGDELAPLASGIGAIEGEHLNVTITPWLAKKLGIEPGSFVIVDNENGKFTITRSARNDRPPP
jgi:hypothetical protein